MNTTNMMFTYTEGKTKQVDFADWRAQSAENVHCLAVARSLLGEALAFSTDKGVAIPGTTTEGFDYHLFAQAYQDAVCAQIHRSDGLLITTLTIVSANSTLARDLGATPPCCVADRAPGVLFARDVEIWLLRFEQALSIAVIEGGFEQETTKEFEDVHG